MLNKMLREIVKKYPDKTTLVNGTSRISFKELYASVTGLSNGFCSIGIGQNDCIAIILQNCPEFIVSFYAAARSRAIFLPVNPLLAEEEFKFYINDSGATAIVTDVNCAEICRNIISGSGRKIELIVTGEGNSYDTNFNDLILDKTADDEERSPYEGIFLYQYTSGSTGRPKRVCKTQKNQYHEARNYASTVNITASDNILCVVPIYHGHGLDHCLLAATSTGATLVFLEEYKDNGTPIKIPFVLRRQRVMELIEKEKITNIPAVPFILSALAETPEDFKADISALKLCFSSGNFLQKEIYDKFMQRFEIPIRQIYGCTETGSIAVNLEGGSDIHFESVGLPLNNIDVRIIDDNGDDVNAGTTGEVAVKSLAMTDEYFNMPELNIEAFRDGYFYTGDFGQKDESGLIYITGRKKILIDTGGYKVDPYEIEDVLVTHPMVKEAVVVGVKGKLEGEVIKAVIVPDGECQDSEIISYCKGKLTDYKIPQIIEFRDKIPKSPVGKILRKDLI
jgi:long-chain acyl-CoA synthetase